MFIWPTFFQKKSKNKNHLKLNLSIKLKSTQGTFGHFKCCNVSMPTNFDDAEILFFSLINRSKMTKLFLESIKSLTVVEAPKRETSELL